jgi:hypothetical protein
MERLSITVYENIIGIPLEAEVRVIQYWDGERPSINSLLPRYYIWRRALMAKDLDIQMEAEQKYRQWDKNKKNAISWIERLVDKPLSDHRKFCIRMVRLWRISLQQYECSPAYLNAILQSPD